MRVIQLKDRIINVPDCTHCPLNSESSKCKLSGKQTPYHDIREDCELKTTQDLDAEENDWR